MKEIAMLFFLLSLMLPVKAQKKSKPEENFYIMDENFKGTTIEKAKYLLHAVKKNDTCWQFDTYNMFGPIISSEQYKDEKGTEANGSSFYYNKKGEVDSAGDFNKGFQHGTWYYFNDTGKVIMKKNYQSGIVTLTEDLLKLDSLKKNNDTSDAHVEVESDFSGGINQWIKYLTKNMEYPERAIKSIIQGKVVVLFTVDADGKVYDARIAKSVEYSLDEEALRLINKSPAWSPASIDGKKVKSYKKQPITFRLQ